MNRLPKTGAWLSAAASASLLIAACSDHTALVEGRLDDLRHLPAKTDRVKVPTYNTSCRTVTRTQTRTTYVNGKSSTRTVTVPVTECTKTKSGIKWASVEVRPETWCIELDNVNGKKDADDRWFRVNLDDYDAAREINHGSVIRFPYRSKGC